MFDTASGWGKKSSPAACASPFYNHRGVQVPPGRCEFPSKLPPEGQGLSSDEQLGRTPTEPTKTGLFCRSLLGKSRLETMELPGVFFFWFQAGFPCIFVASFKYLRGESRSENKGLRYRACWPESSSFQRGNGWRWFRTKNQFFVNHGGFFRNFHIIGTIGHGGVTKKIGGMGLINRRKWSISVGLLVTYMEYIGYIWVNFITTSRRDRTLESWLVRGIIPKWPNNSG